MNLNAYPEHIAHLQKSAADPQAAGWLKALNSALDALRANSNEADAEKIHEMIQFHGVDGVSTPRVVVNLDGGCIQSVTASGPADVLFLDADIEGADPENIKFIDGRKVYASRFSLKDDPESISPKSVTATFDQAELGRYIYGGWSHIFAGSGYERERLGRILFDRLENRLVALDLHTSFGRKVASTIAIQDVEDSLINANPEALINPEHYGLSHGDSMPEWACAENGLAGSLAKDINATKITQGELIGELVGILANVSDDASQEFHLEVIDEVQSYLAAEAANAESDPADQERVIAEMESWVSNNISNAGAHHIIAAAIEMSSADETASRVRALPQAGDEPEAPAP